MFADNHRGRLGRRACFCCRDGGNSRPGSECKRKFIPRRRISGFDPSRANVGIRRECSRYADSPGAREEDQEAAG